MVKLPPESWGVASLGTGRADDPKSHGTSLMRSPNAVPPSKTQVIERFVLHAVISTLVAILALIAVVGLAIPYLINARTNWGVVLAIVLAAALPLALIGALFFIRRAVTRFRRDYESARDG